MSRLIALLVVSTNSLVTGLKTNFGKSVELAGGDGKVTNDFSFIASFVPIVEKWTFTILAIDGLSQCASPSTSIQEIGELY